MSATTVKQPASLPRDVSGSKAVGWWGMLMVIVTEATLFGALLSSYFYLRFLAPVWPPDGIARPELALPGAMTVILLASSLPMHLAERGIRQGKQSHLKWGLAVSFVLGALFLMLQSVEYARSEFAPWTNAYGSLFFTITGFHGLHVVGALLLNAWAQMHAWRGWFSAERFRTVENVAIYWHFVDAVWVVILLALYLSPYLS